MTFDEIFVLHERTKPIMERIIGDNATGIFRFNWLLWVIPFGAIVIVLGFVFYKFWYQLPSKTKLAFLIAAIMFIGGAIGLELVEGLVADRYPGDNLIMQFVSTIQESLEMFGVILFIWSLLDFIAEHYKEIYFSFEGSNHSKLESPK